MRFLSSGNNAILVDNCQNLQNLTVTLQATQDLITLGNTGFSLQLNCYPQPASQSQGQTLNWFQYIIYVGGPINNQLGWEIQYWSIGAPSAWPTGYTPNPPNTTPWLPVLPNDFSVQSFGSAPSTQMPAGSLMQIQLATDSNGNVTTATFSVTDPSGHVSSYPFMFPAGAVYPIYGFQVDVVGPGGGSACTFTSGAGSLTCSVSPGALSVQSASTNCGGPQPGTGESSNAVYGDLTPASGATVSQSLYINAATIAAASWGANRLDVFVIGPQNNLYHKAWNGAAWDPSSPANWDNLGGNCSSAPAVASWGPNRLDVFVVGPQSNLYHKAWNGTAWDPSSPADWDDLGGNCSSAPTVVSWGQNRLDIFVVGPQSNLYHKAWNGTAWDPSSPADWDDLGGNCSSVPAVASWGPNRLDVFVVGPQNNLYHKAWNGAAWDPSSPADWDNLGGNCSSAPTVVSWGPNRLDVFVVGPQNNLYHKAWNGTAWDPSSPADWENLGGNCSSAPTVVSWGPNRLDIFVVGPQNNLYHKAWNGTAWDPSSPADWENLGGNCSSAPAVVSWGQNRLDVFVVGPQNNLYHKAWNGTAWDPSSPADWEDLGGQVSII